jgi:hypothetical protein
MAGMLAEAEVACSQALTPWQKELTAISKKRTMRLQTMTGLHRLILRSDIMTAEQNEKPTQRTWTVIMKVRMTSCYLGLLLAKRNKTSSKPLIR